MNHDVFISYAHASALQEACALRAVLEAAGIHVFLDERSILPGSEFPTDIADALLKSLLILVLTDESYFQRPWCVYEFQVAIAPYRTAAMPTISDLDHIIIALPIGRSAETVVSHLPPVLAQRSWPRSDQTIELVELIKERLSSITIPIETRLRGINDEAVLNLRKGGAVSQAAPLGSVPSYLQELPTSQKERFVGRVEELWRIFHLLQTYRIEGGFTSCALVGAGGVGKTQLAAEYLWRYGPKYYLGGLVWIKADCDESTRINQFFGVINALAPYQKMTGSLEKDIEEFGKAIKAIQQPILWVVDNIPEPSKDSPPRSIEYWCPVQHYVTLLCTSRHTVSGVEATLHIDELSVVAAVELLTKPEVQRAWLNDIQWKTIATWVGCLPLALRILHSSLSENFISVDEILVKAQGAEPAPALDVEFEALREEIPADHVRGVAEAFHVSYQLLTHYPILRDAVQYFARLSPIPIEEGIIKALIPSKVLGRLASRGWIQTTPTGISSVRQWRMHPVIASYLRSQSSTPDGELSTLANWLIQIYRSDRPWSELLKYVAHLLHIFREIQVLSEEHPGDKSHVVELGKQLIVCMMDALLSDIDKAQYLVGPPLRREYTPGLYYDPLWKLPHSTHAQEALKSLARNNFDKHAYDNLVSALQEAVGSKLQLQAVDRIGLYLRVFGTPLPVEISQLDISNIALEQRIEIQIPVAPSLSPELFGPLTQVALKSIDQKVAERAVLTIGLSLSGVQALSTIVHGCLDSAKYEQVISFTNTIAQQFPKLSNVYWWRGLAMDGLGRTSEAIKDYGRVLGLSPKLADVRFRRGIAFEKLGREDDALREYDRAIQLEPTFPDPYYQYARILFEKEEFATAIRYVETLAKLMPDDGLPYHVKAACLFNLEDYNGANVAATQAIERDDKNAETWYFRALARFYNGEATGALEDLKHAFKLNSSDPRLFELQHQIQQAAQQ